jgi:hypothetical protein
LLAVQQLPELLKRVSELEKRLKASEKEEGERGNSQ